MGVRHHTPDSYSKEVDHTPPSDAKVHRVDPESDRVQKPYEAPSGWSRAGVKTDEYRTDVLKGGKSTTSWLWERPLTEVERAEMSKGDEGPKSSPERKL